MIIRPGMASHAAAQAKAEQAPPAAVPSSNVAASAPAGGAAAPAEMPLGKIQVLSGPGAGKELELKRRIHIRQGTDNYRSKAR